MITLTYTRDDRSGEGLKEIYIAVGPVYELDELISAMAQFAVSLGHDSNEVNSFFMSKQV